MIALPNSPKTALPGRAVISVLLVAGFVLAAGPADARRGAGEFIQVLSGPGPLAGTVSDARGVPLIGAFVGAVVPGSSEPLAFALTGKGGRFALRDLVPGIYTLVAGSIGFAGTVVQGIVIPQVEPVNLQLLVKTERDLSSVEGPIDLGWSVRRRVRDVLRQDEGLAMGAAGESPRPDDRRLASSPAAARDSVYAEVSLWTLAGVTDDDSPSGATSVALVGAPSASDAGVPSWRFEAHVNQEGSVWTHSDIQQAIGEDHALSIGVGYVGQTYQFGILPGGAREGRSGDLPWMGRLDAQDRWRLSQPVALTYGLRVEHHDYISEAALFSPRLQVSVSPGASWGLVTGVSYSSEVLGLEGVDAGSAPDWGLGCRDFDIVPVGALEPERAVRYRLGLRQRLGAAEFQVRAFYDDVSNDILGVYFQDPDGVGDYLVFNVGDSSVRGFEVAVGTSFFDRVTGELTYSYGNRDGDRQALDNAVGQERLQEAMLRFGAPGFYQDTHELQASVGAFLEGPQTRVLAVYYWKRGFPVLRGGQIKEDYGRFDLRVRQPLPFRALDTEWSALVHLRNLIGSEYDGLFDFSLAEVRNLSRAIAGGLAVRF